jgi:hypothetical protein
MPKEDGEVLVRLVANGPHMFATAKGHCINGQTYYCNRVYPAADFNDGAINPDCAACNAYKNGWAEQSKLPYHKLSWLRSIKPFNRYFYLAIQREQEAKGLQLLSTGRQLHHAICTGLARTPRTIDVLPETRWDEFKNWLGFNKIIKANVIDIRHGSDLKIIRKMGGEDWMHGQRFPDYSKSCFMLQSTPAGDPFQVQEWEYKGKNTDMLESIRLDFQKDIVVALAKFDPSFGVAVASC